MTMVVKGEKWRDRDCGCVLTSTGTPCGVWTLCVSLDCPDGTRTHHAIDPKLDTRIEVAPVVMPVAMGEDPTASGYPAACLQCGRTGDFAFMCDPCFGTEDGHRDYALLTDEWTKGARDFPRPRADPFTPFAPRITAGGKNVGQAAPVVHAWAVPHDCEKSGCGGRGEEKPPSGMTLTPNGGRPAPVGCGHDAPKGYGGLCFPCHAKADEADAFAMMCLAPPKPTDPAYRIREPRQLDARARLLGDGCIGSWNGRAPR